MPPGEYSLDIDYAGRVNDGAQGLFALSYDRGPQQMLATQLEPADARRLMPCWDEPAIKATFAVSVTARRDWIALSNMPEAKVEDLSDGVPPQIDDWLRRTLAK